MSFEYFNSFPGGSSSRSYGYLHDQLPRSYHRQPPSPEDGSSNSPTGGGNYSPSSTDMKLNNADQFDMASLASRSYPDQTLILPGPSGRHFGESSMVGHVSGPSGTHPLSSDISGSQFPPNHPNMFDNYGYGTGPPQYDLSLTQMHGLGSALTAEMHTTGDYTHSPSPSDSSLEDDGSTYSSSSPPPTTYPLPPQAETEEYLRRALEIPRHVPVDLNALPDYDPTTEKKQPPITNMIKLAIWGSKHKRLTLRQIYDEIEKRYPTLKESKDKPWQRSIRHNLSLKAMFVRVERPVSHPGKGFYWAIDTRQGEGNKRDRKRKDQSGSGRRSRSHEDEDEEGMSEELEDDEPAPQRVIQGGRASERRGVHQPLRLPQETQHLPGPYAQLSSNSLLQRPSVPSQGVSILDPTHQMPYNMGPHMRWDQRPQYGMQPETSTMPMVNMDMQMQMQMGRGAAPGFPSYALPSNIENRPIPFRSNVADAAMGVQGFQPTGYPQMVMPQMGTPMGPMQGPMMGIPSVHPNSSSSSRRPSPDEDPSISRSSRKHRTH